MRWICTTALALTCACGVPSPGASQAQAWDMWNVSEEASDQIVDHEPWQAFLERYVSAGADGINRVAYARAAAEARPELDAYLQRLGATDPRTLRRDEQFAYWVNLYNALTVALVLEHPGHDTIKRMGAGLPGLGPWDDEVISIAGTALTLNDIEHRILRPIWRDHRVHFAVNCAALGCPNLNRSAYRRDNTAALLARAEAEFINQPRGVRLTADGRLHLSSLFEWYLQDFADDERGLLAYLARHHRQLGDTLASYDGGLTYAYDWALNAAR